MTQGESLAAPPTAARSPLERYNAVSGRAGEGPPSHPTPKRLQEQRQRQERLWSEEERRGAQAAASAIEDSEHGPSTNRRAVHQRKQWHERLRLQTPASGEEAGLARRGLAASSSPLARGAASVLAGPASPGASAAGSASATGMPIHVENSRKLAHVAMWRAADDLIEQHEREHGIGRADLEMLRARAGIGGPRGGKQSRNGSGGGGSRAGGAGRGRGSPNARDGRGPTHYGAHAPSPSHVPSAQVLTPRLVLPSALPLGGGHTSNNTDIGSDMGSSREPGAIVDAQAPGPVERVREGLWGDSDSDSDSDSSVEGAVMPWSHAQIQRWQLRKFVREQKFRLTPRLKDGSASLAEPPRVNNAVNRSRPDSITH
eukprot:g3301.t1